MTIAAILGLALAGVCSPGFAADPSVDSRTRGDSSLVEAQRELLEKTSAFREQEKQRKGRPQCLINIRFWRASTIPESQIEPKPGSIIGYALANTQKIFGRRGIQLSFVYAGALPERFDGKWTGIILRDPNSARGLLAHHATIGDLDAFVASTSSSPSVVLVGSIVGEGNPAGVTSLSRNTAAAERPWGSDVISHELGHVFGLADRDMVRGGDRFLPSDEAWARMVGNCKNRTWKSKGE